MRLGTLIIVLFPTFLLFVYGLYDSPFSIGDRESDFKVDAEYITGILTASGILFGIWAIILERKPRGKVKKWLYEHIISKGFFVSFAFLVISVIVVFLTALNLFSSVLTVLFCTISFCYNALIMSLTVYFYKFFFKETKKDEPWRARARANSK